jgi:hypothetical protein
MNTFFNEIYSLATSPTFLIIAGILYFIYRDTSKNINGFKYVKYPFSSSINPMRVVDGRIWTSTSVIKSRLNKKSEHDFFIGNFRYSPKVIQKCHMPTAFKTFNEKTKIYLQRNKLKQTTLVWGGMGSGKTVFFLNLLDQIDKYDNALIHDGGKLEMVSKLYNPMRDIIFNPYDDRATIHNLLNEDTAIQLHFFELLLKSKSGKEVNFFSTGASEHLRNISLSTNAQNFHTTKKKWAYFMDRVEALINDVMINGESKSERDVIATLKQVLTPLQLMNFRIQNGANTFTINNFLDKNHAAKLFVSYPPALRPIVQNISSAFIALFTMVHLSREDTKKKHHLYLIDELSSYLRMLNDTETLKDQVELLRSKGGIFIGGLQGDDEEEKYNQILDKTVHQKFYFRTDGLKTKESLVKKVGKVKYIYANKTKSINASKHDGGRTYTLANADTNVIKEDDFLALGDKYEYIAIIGDILYRGHTPLPLDELNGNKRAEPFIEYRYRKKFEDLLAEKYDKLSV